MIRGAALFVGHDPDTRAFQTDTEQTDSYLTTRAKFSAMLVALVGLVTEFGCKLDVEEVSFP